jgi:hypothetical protein
MEAIHTERKPMNPMPDDNATNRNPDDLRSGWSADSTWDVDPAERIFEWMYMEGCVNVEASLSSVVTSMELRGIEYHSGPSTDPDAEDDGEIISTLVAGSPLPAEVLGELVEARLPQPLPNNLFVEVKEIEENDVHCWLVRRITTDQIADDAQFAALMKEFVAITEKFVEEWTAA